MAEGIDLRRGRAFQAKLTDDAGRLEATVFFQAPKEAEAIERVRRFTKSRSVELWDGSRLIASMPVIRQRFAGGNTYDPDIDN